VGVLGVEFRYSLLAAGEQTARQGSLEESHAALSSSPHLRSSGSQMRAVTGQVASRAFSQAERAASLRVAALTRPALRRKKLAPPPGLYEVSGDERGDLV